MSPSLKRMWSSFLAVLFHFANDCFFFLMQLLNIYMKLNHRGQFGRGVSRLLSLFRRYHAKMSFNCSARPSSIYV